MSRRKGLEKALTIVIVIIVCLAVGIALLVMTGDNLKHFFENVDITSDDTIETVDCKAKCFDCCMRTPDVCDTLNWKTENKCPSGCNC